MGVYYVSFGSIVFRFNFPKVGDDALDAAGLDRLEARPHGERVEDEI